MAMISGRRARAAAAGVLAIAIHASAFGATAQGASAAGPPVDGAPTTAAPPAAPPAPGTPTSPAAPANKVLSNERTVTVWAHPVTEANIRERPLEGARIIARTHLATEDGYPEVYLLLSTFIDARGQTWVRMRIPGRPNGRIGWVLRGSLGEFHVTHWLILISLSGHWLKAYDNGRVRFRAPVGVGKPSSPTPPGHFWIRERFRVENRGNPYWPYAMGTSDYSTLTDWPGGGVVGIHGDLGEPNAIPGAPSHGCVRLRDRDIARLAPQIPLGTPVHIIR
jgi:L,D-transpeptidase catalytic domain